MSKKFLEYYENYDKTYGANGYSLEKVKQTSRVRIFKELIEAKCSPGAKILDVGCGDMYFARLMPQFEWTGIDCNPRMSEGRAIVQDLETPPYDFDAKSFDMIICSEVLEHLYDLRVVHREVHRLLKDQGFYLISTPNFDHADQVYSHYRELITDFNQSHLVEHIRFYTPATHRAFLDECGFREIYQCGADAHYSRSASSARKRMPEVLKKKYGIIIDEFEADEIMGKCFVETSHTTIHLGVKK